jgi:hypothetical protein
MSRDKKSVYEPTELPDGRWQIKNLQTAEPCTRITALLFGFKHFRNKNARKYLFWEIAHVFWQKHHDEGEALLERNEWADQIINDLAGNKYTGFGGCGSSGKSHVVAAWCIVCFLCDPANTMVFITTTTMKDADQRIWGSIITLMNPLEDVFPVRNRPSMHDYVYHPENMKMQLNRGIFLVAAEKKKTKEAMGRFIGKKAPHILLAADELGELSPAIMNAGVANLSKGGRESFQATGMSNPDSPFDAFGDWVCPENGWESVDLMNDMAWKTKWGGHYRRFDARQSPHIDREKSYLPTQGDIDEAAALLGAHSRAFYRMWLAVFFTSGGDRGVFGELEVVKSGASSPGPNLVKVIGRVGGLDPSFTNGGDRCLFRWGELGYTDTGRMVLALRDPVHLEDDVNAAEPRSYQIANQLKEVLAKYKVPLRHVAVDATGAGAPLCDVIDSVGKDRCFRVGFGESPTMHRVNPRVKRTAKEMYRNRVTEMWFVGKELMRCKQVYNLDPDTAKELTNREYDQRKGATGLRVQLESKADYKRRTNMPSPDLADTTMLLIDSARENFSFYPIEPPDKDEAGDFRPPPPSLASLDVAGQSDGLWL